MKQRRALSVEGRETAASPSVMTFRSIAALSINALVLSACVSSSGTVTGSSPSTLDARRSTLAWTDSVLRTLSVREKAAQLVWPWILGDYVPVNSAEWQRLVRLVSEEKVGGFIVSVGGPLDIAVKLNALQRLSDLPLIVSADLETGAGFRVRNGYFVPNAIDLGGATTFPLQMALGAARDPELAYEQGRITAVEARAIGIHIAFGPDLDVNNNPANPVIGARSFSEDPQLAARLGAAFVRGTQEHGMLATGKHFPGHGDTETNSHLSLSTVTASRARLDSVELVPFRAAIEAGVGAIMTYHGILPALDTSGVPATLSPRVLQGVLRTELKFNGLIVSDAMDMAGVVEQFGAVEAAKRAVAAGNDVVLMPADIKQSIDAVAAGVAEGRYTEARLDESVRRILDLKKRFGLDRSRFAHPDTVRRLVGDSSHLAVARRVAQRGIVLAKDSLGAVPFTRDGRRPRLLSITYARRADLGAGTTFNAELRRNASSLRSEYVNSEDPGTNFARLTSAADSADVVIVGSYVNISSTSATASTPRAFTDFVNDLVARGVRPVVVTFGTPYLLQQMPGVPAYLIAWGGTTVSQQAAARALTGVAPISGRLPISIPPLLPIGAGVMREARALTTP